MRGWRNIKDAHGTPRLTSNAQARREHKVYAQPLPNAVLYSSLFLFAPCSPPGLQNEAFDGRGCGYHQAWSSEQPPTRRHAPKTLLARSTGGYAGMRKAGQKGRGEEGQGDEQRDQAGSKQAPGSKASLPRP